MKRLSAGVVATALVLSGCTLGSDSDSDSDSGAEGGKRVVLVTHDSFAAPQELLDEFRRDSGITIDVRKLGDAGALTNQLVLTKDSPVGAASCAWSGALRYRAGKLRAPFAPTGPEC